MPRVTKATLLEENARLMRQLEDERSHHAAQCLDRMDAAFCEAQRLVDITRRWAKNPAAWDKENECRTFRQIRYAVEHAMQRLDQTEKAMADRIVHCWEIGPPEADGCSTTCMLLDGHDGPHEWTRDDEIQLSFAPSQAQTEPQG